MHVKKIIKKKVVYADCLLAPRYLPGSTNIMNLFAANITYIFSISCNSIFSVP